MSSTKVSSSPSSPSSPSNSTTTSNSPSTSTTSSFTLSLFRNCKLTKLDLYGKEISINDNWLDITHGQMMRSTLSSINISKNNSLTDQGIANLSHLTNLNSLDISFCEKINGSGLEILVENNVPLQKLQLEGCNSINIERCLKVLANLKSLDSLNLSSTKVSDVDCQLFVNLKSLTQLDISRNSDISNIGLEHICNISTLKDLDLSRCTKITELGFQSLSKLPHLESLQAEECGINDESMKSIGTLRELRSLILISNPFTNEGAHYISNLTSLTALDLSMCTNITDSALVHFQNLSQLSRLNLNFCGNLTDSGVATLTGGLGHLTTLGIIGCNRLLIKVKHRPLVLLVEDNPLQVKVITKVMERYNFDVEVASNGQMALDMFRSNPRYELVLMDIIMPIMDGLTATMLIREYERERGLRRTPVIMQTADSRESHRMICLAAGCDDFMTKPLDKRIIERAWKLLKEDEN
eukprot:gene4691-5859_t